MTARKNLWALLLFTVFFAVNIWAGDTATFVDLGFSPDGKTYAFAQYGIQAETLKPWAELFVVDVNQNNFVSGGRVSYVHDSPVVAGQDGSGALYRIITRNIALIDRYGVNFLLQGNPLFISLDEPSSPARQNIDFRDFGTGAFYQASLVSKVEGSGTTLTSSFYIDLEKTGKDGTKKTYTVGTPTLKRSQIASYRIRKVITAPNDGSMILIIEMKKQSGTDFDIRYMVEALRQ
jgi:predicted secreted protein